MSNVWSLRLSGCKEPPGAGCAAPGERHFYLPGSPPHHHHHRLFCTTLHPNAPCPTRRFVGSAFPPDSPLFTRLFQIRQNVKPKNGTWRDWNSFGAQKRFKPGWFVDPLLCPAGAGCLSPPSTKTVAAATCRCSGTALRLSAVLHSLQFLHIQLCLLKSASICHEIEWRYF